MKHIIDESRMELEYNHTRNFNRGINMMLLVSECRSICNSYDACHLEINSAYAARESRHMKGISTRVKTNVT